LGTSNVDDQAQRPNDRTWPLSLPTIGRTRAHAGPFGRRDLNGGFLGKTAVGMSSGERS
jgi:hypothetical protein